MLRIRRLASLVLASALPLAAVASDEVVYHQPAGIDVEAEWDALEGDLDAVMTRAAYGIRGEILTTREDIGGAGPVTVVAVVVDEVLRGNVSNGAVVEVEVPLDGPISGDRPSHPVPVRGYDVIVFLDPHGDVVPGGLFLVEGGFAWRPSRPGVLFSPRLQQDWEDVIDPISDYDVYTLDAMRSAANSRRGPAANGRRARRGR